MTKELEKEFKHGVENIKKLFGIFLNFGRRIWANV